MKRKILLTLVDFTSDIKNTPPPEDRQEGHSEDHVELRVQEDGKSESSAPRTRGRSNRAVPAAQIFLRPETRARPSGTGLFVRKTSKFNKKGCNRQYDFNQEVLWDMQILAELLY